MVVNAFEHSLENWYIFFINNVPCNGHSLICRSYMYMGENQYFTEPDYKLTIIILTIVTSLNPYGFVLCVESMHTTRWLCFSNIISFIYYNFVMITNRQSGNSKQSVTE